MRTILLLGIFSIYMTTLRAQTEAWTLRQCMDTAWRNNLAIQQAGNNIALQAVHIAQSKSNRLPTLNASLNQTFGSGRTLNPATYQFTNDNVWGNQATLTSTVTLFNGFQNANLIRQSEVNHAGARYDGAQTERDIALAVANAYLQVLLAGEMHALAVQQVEVTARQVAQTEALFEKGLRAESDVLLLKAQLASDRLAEVKAEGAWGTAKLTLQQWMQVVPSPEFEVAPLAAEDTLVDLPPDASTVYDDAVGDYPAVQAGQLALQGAAYGVRIARGAAYPSLSLRGTVGTTYSSASRRIVGPPYTAEEYPFGSQVDDNLNTSLVLSLNIPILNSFQVDHAVEQQEIQLRNARLNVQGIENDLRQAIAQAYVAAANAVETYRATQLQVEAVAASWENTQGKYRHGLLNTTELLVEQNRYRAALSDHLAASYEARIRLRMLDYYRGLPIE